MTDQRLHQKPLPISHFFRTLVESSTDFIFTKDCQLRYLSINAAAARAAGKPEEEILGKDDFYLFPSDTAEKIRALEMALLADGRPRTIQETLPLNGNVRHLSTSKGVVRDSTGRIIGLVGISRDITEFKNAENALRESAVQERERRAEIATIMEAIPAAVFIAHDPLCHSMTGNRAVHELLQVPSNKDISKSAPNNTGPCNFEVYHGGRKLLPEELPLQRAAASGQAVRDAELELRFDDGTERIIFGNALPLVDEHGRSRGAVGAFLDVSAYKELQRTLQQTHRAKDNFLATLAHELRNPLAPVRNVLQILRQTQLPASKQMTWALDVMDRQVQHMTRLVDDLLEVSRITQGKVELRKQRCDVASVMKASVEAVRSSIDESSHELILMFPDAPIILYVDSTRIVQVLENLLNNAAKYTPRGGKIWLSAEQQGDEAVIKVRDSGIGIPKQDLRHVFEMFSQLGPARDRSQGGMGIGLALVRALVELHGGTVRAESDGDGKGSEFTVRLPICGVADDADGATPRHAIGTDEPRRILVVEDNRDTAESLAVLLELRGHAVRIAYDGVTALAIGADFAPTMVLLDIGLPNIDGYEVARRIRQQAWGKGVLLVALTGWGQEQDKRAATQAGFDHHLTKPLDFNELGAILGAGAQ